MPPNEMMNSLDAKYPSYQLRRTKTTLSNTDSTSDSDQTSVNTHYYGGSSSSSITAHNTSYAKIQDSVGDFDEDQFGIIDSLDYDDVDTGLIDDEIIYQHRETLIHELYTSEKAYVESLELLMYSFLEPLRKSTKSSSFNFLGMKKLPCTDRELKWLFCNVEEILLTHQKILKSLEERLRIWGPTQIISDVFEPWLLSLPVYRTYLNNYGISVTTYERLKRYRPFKKFIDSAHNNPNLKGKSLLSLLQVPVGCVNRYVQIVCPLVNGTSPMHPDYAGLMYCKKQILSMADHLKELIDDTNNVDQVLTIQTALMGAPFGVKAQRRLVLQGQLSRIAINTKTVYDERTYILFSDILIFVRPKLERNNNLLQYKGHLELEHARIRRLSASEAGGFNYCIEVTSSFEGVDTLNNTYMGSPTVHVLCMQSQKEQDEWFTQLTCVIKALDHEATLLKAEANRRLYHNRSTINSLSRQRTSSSNMSKLSVQSVKSLHNTYVPVAPLK